MPNWCSNSIKVVGTKEYIEGMAAAFFDGKLLNYIAPVDAGDNWYEANIATWGTKWDVGGEDFYYEVIEGDDGQWTFAASFDSAWSPPIEAYQTLVDKGIFVEAYYYEPGMNFCGRFDEDGDDCYQIEGDSDWVVANVPEDIDVSMGISESMEVWEEEEVEYIAESVAE